jgi:DNA polymerase-3 subunit epsilon
MSLSRRKLANRLLRARLAGRSLAPLAAANLRALEHLEPGRPALGFDYVVIDLETTGLDPLRDRVVSVGAVRLRRGRVLLGDRFCELINHGRNISEEAIKIHGITPDMLGGARKALEVFDEFLAWLGADILVAHYAGFDMHFIQRTMRAAHGFALQNLVLDTVRMCQGLILPSDPYGVRGSKRACSLDALATRFGLPLPERHTALGGALTTAMIFQRLLAKLEQAGGSALRDLARVAELAAG